MVALGTNRTMILQFQSPNQILQYEGLYQAFKPINTGCSNLTTEEYNNIVEWKGEIQIFFLKKMVSESLTLIFNLLLVIREAFGSVISFFSEIKVRIFAIFS